jgi:hypothetical protein
MKRNEYHPDAFSEPENRIVTTDTRLEVGQPKPEDRCPVENW